MVAALPSRLRARPRDRDLVQHRIDLGELAEGDDLVVALLLAIAREALQPQLVPAETPAKPAGDKDRRLHAPHRQCDIGARREPAGPAQRARSEEHTSELQSLMRTSYAVFCLKKKNNTYKK